MFRYRVTALFESPCIQNSTQNSLMRELQFLIFTLRWHYRKRHSESLHDQIEVLKSNRRNQFPPARTRTWTFPSNAHATLVRNDASGRRTRGYVIGVPWTVFEQVSIVVKIVQFFISTANSSCIFSVLRVERQRCQTRTFQSIKIDAANTPAVAS